MEHNVYIYMAIMAGVTYLIRVLPLTLIRKEIKSTFIRSFLFYVPYVTLAVMTFPAIITATDNPIAAGIAFAVAVLLAWFQRSLFQVAKEYLGLEAEEREITLEEVKDMAECGLCGTAAVISPVGKIVDHGKEICLPSGMTQMGPITQKLYDTLTGIQMGRIQAPEGWIRVIK